MRETIRNGKSEVIAYRETGSGNREIPRNKNNRILGRFDSNTGVTRTADGSKIGWGSNELLHLLK